MIESSKRYFSEWVTQVKKRREDEERRAEDALVEQRRQEERNRKAAKIAEKESEKEREKWQKRKEEDTRLLREKGALAVFNDATRIMKREPSFKLPWVEIIDPQPGEEPKEAHIQLIWGQITNTPSGNSQPGCWRESNGVTCFVARNENGVALGYRLNGSAYVMPFEKNNALLSRSIAEAVQKTHVENLTIKWFDFK
jgi:hypothetical protein